MKNLVVLTPSIKEPIQPSPGFEKKLLSEAKLDIIGLCGFGCTYCSSNNGNYLRINRERFSELTQNQTGIRSYPSEDPALTFEWPDILSKLEAQLSQKKSDWGRGKTLVFSMLTDGFSPNLVKAGTTKKALGLLIERTNFRIRVLTKNAIVGTRAWIDFFGAHADRFVVGLSIGTLDNDWARRVEMGTSLPSARIRALRNLQDEGISTYGMLCPVFPDVLEHCNLEDLVDRIRPALTERFWAEPYNDRNNWEIVRRGYRADSPGYQWFTQVFEERKKEQWSGYATELYVRLLEKAREEGWLSKLTFLLYEDQITERDAKYFQGFEGILLQSKPQESGLSRNPRIAKYQQRSRAGQSFGSTKHYRAATKGR